MPKSSTFASFFGAGLALICAFSPSLRSQAAGIGRSSRPLISGRIDETKLYTLAGNTRSQANPENDQGAVPDSLVLDHLLLALQRPAEQERAVEQFLEDVQNPKSASYHHWLTAVEFGQRFGPAQQDIHAVTGWLESHGFTVNQVYPSGMTIDFSGSAGQVREAFRTEIHRLNVNGAEHIANLSDPQIPEALAPAVAGIVSLHDFRPRTMKSQRKFTYSSGGVPYQALVPADLATIYNLNPLYSAGITGKGQTIAVLEDTDLYSTADWSSFRSTFGLSTYTSGTLTTVHPAPPSGRNNCANPGIPSGGDDGEAALDAEWASAAAPDAAIQVAACADTRTTFGGLIALENMLNSATTASTAPGLISISYGECEAENGSASNTAFSDAYMLAATQGVSVFVAAGDEGAASCDSGATTATHGIGVSAYASTPYNVAVGGTDFSDSYNNTNNTYWNPTNTAVYGSAISYIPEIPWNDSCASILLTLYSDYTVAYGSGGFCNSSTAQEGQLVEVVGGSGGPSGCATGSPSKTGVVGGSCKGYAKPSWQSVLGNPADGVRDIPDVSLFAADGLWGHYYVFCWSDVRQGGARCTGDPSNWAGAGGTSFASPIMAGIQALINQHAGGLQGNPNPTYYSLAAAEYASSSGAGACNSNSPASTCVFYDVTLGDIVMNCAGSVGCFGAGATSGIGHGRGGGSGGSARSTQGSLSTTSTGSYSPAYATGTGWDFATGIGTINAYNLVMAWPK